MQSFNYSSKPEYETDHAIDYSRREPDRGTSRRRPSYSRSGTRPVMVNGIHRRRHKRIQW